MTDRIILLKKNKVIGSSCYFFIVYALFFLTGSNNEFRNYILISLLFLWTVVASVEDPKSFSTAIGGKETKYLFLFLGYYFFTSILESDFLYTMTYIGVYIMIYTSYVQCIYYFNRGNYNEISIVVRFSILGWIILSIASIAFYMVNPSAARMLAADFNAFDNLYIGGGYAIAFGSALLLVYIVSLVCSEKLSKKYNVYALLCVCMLYFLLIKTESTTTVIASSVGCLYCVYERMKNSKYKKCFYTLFILFLLFIVSGGLESVLSYVSSSTDVESENLYSRRFNRIGEKLLSFGSHSTSAEDNYVDERWGLVVESFNTFLENPIFGIGYKVGNVFAKLEGIGIGTHSEICDILAQFGIFGSFFFFRFFITAYRRVNMGVVNKGIVITLFIMVLMNPFHYFHGFYVLFLLVPMIRTLTLNNQK